MTFNSYLFLIFFPIVVVVYYGLPHQFRWLWLLLASCYFYMAFIPVFIFVLLALIVIDYVCALLISKTQGRMKKFFLWFSIGSTCLVLLVFKYFNFFNENVAHLAQILHWNYPIQNLKVLLPLGLSFHTFQSLSYVIEVYRGTIKPERHFGLYSLYVMFFPQLVSGPIERPGHLLPQFRKEKIFDYRGVTDGLKLMAWGMFKKVVIADRLAVVVNHVYGHCQSQAGIHLWLATFFFAFQIYTDFSGYSDIAVGAGQVLGFRLMQNFNLPYFAKSIPEYWQRWHISLSTWFRDYVFVPLGRRQLSMPQWYKNILITFLISGLWHGANWTFLVWGGMHGIYYVFGAWSKSFRMKFFNHPVFNQIPNLKVQASQAGVFILVYFSWVIFRSESIQQAVSIYRHMFLGFGNVIQFGQEANQLGVTGTEFLGCFGVIFVLIVVENFHLYLQRSAYPVPVQGLMRGFLARQPVWVRWPVYMGCVFVTMNLGIAIDVPFIYFQF